MKLTVLIHCRNAQASILDLLGGVESSEPLPHQLIVVDQGSTDGTRQTLHSFLGRPGHETPGEHRCNILAIKRIEV